MGLGRPEARTADCHHPLCDESSVCQWWSLMLHVLWQASPWAELAGQREGST